jgi:asparagine synthetase B (glutamine-hydrolysing)
LKVALSGLGGDEVFGGYPTFRTTPRVAAVARLARAFPASLRRFMSESLVAIGRNGRASSRTDALRKFGAVWTGPDTLPHPYFFARLLFTSQQLDYLLLARKSASPAAWRATLAQVAAGACELGGDAAVSSLEMRSYMVNTLLRDTDAMSMAHSHCWTTRWSSSSPRCRIAPGANPACPRPCWPKRSARCCRVKSSTSPSAPSLFPGGAGCAGRSVWKWPCA